MSFTGNYLCTSFKKELLKGIHNFSAIGGNTFKLALYNNSASFNAATTAYTNTHEVAPSGTYVAGGGVLTNIEPSESGTTAFVDFQDLSFSNTTFTAYGALIYNDSVVGKPAVAVLDFGGAKTTSNSTFQIIFPASTADSAIIKIA